MFFTFYVIHPWALGHTSTVSLLGHFVHQHGFPDDFPTDFPPKIFDNHRKPYPTDLCAMLYITDVKISLCMSCYTCLDRREKRPLPLSFHHLAWLWRAWVPCIFPRLFVQGSRIWLIGAWEWAGCGPLQCWDWPFRDILFGWHLLGPGKSLPFNPFLLNLRYNDDLYNLI